MQVYVPSSRLCRLISRRAAAGTILSYKGTYFIINSKNMCIIFHLSPSCSPRASLRQRRRRDMPPQEETFRAPGGGVSAPERRPFGSQEAAFYKSKGIVLIFNTL